MNNKLLMTGMVAVALLFGFGFAGCDNGTTGNGADPALNGTWGASMEGSEVEYKLNNGLFEYSLDGSPASKGTYTTNGNNLILTMTHIHGHLFQKIAEGSSTFEGMMESKWYTPDEFKASAYGTFLLENLGDNAIIDSMYTSQTASYSVSGNTLALTVSAAGDTGTITLTRK